MAIRHSTQIIFGLLITIGSIGYSAVKIGPRHAEIGGKIAKIHTQRSELNSSTEFTNDIISYFLATNGRIDASTIWGVSAITSKIRPGDSVNKESVEAVLRTLTAEERIALSERIAVETSIIQKVKAATANHKGINDIADVANRDIAILNLFRTLSPDLYFAYRQIDIKNSPFTEDGLSLSQLRNIIDRLDKDSLGSLKDKLDSQSN
jgi:hypothetical protein